MRRDLPAFVVAYCNSWGSQKRRMWMGREWYLDSEGKRQYDVDGYAESLLGRIREERDGAAQGQMKQHWAEVLRGHALEVQRAIAGMPENPSLAGHLHYVFPKDFGLSITQKAALIELSKADYWRELEVFEWWICARLDTGKRSNSVSHCADSKRHLHLVEKRADNRPCAVASPELSFEALRRPVLTVPKKPAA